MDDDIDCDPLGQVFTDLDGNKFYTSLNIKGLHVSLGSFVKVILEKDDDNNDLNSYGYCQILSIYDKVVIASDEGIVNIEVRWFLEPYEIGRVKKIGIELSDNELVETDHLDDIPAGAICEIINIVGYDKNNDNKNINNSTSNIKTFQCRYMETRETNAILKVNIRSIFERGMALSEYNHAYISHLETCKDIDASVSDIYSKAIRQLHISVLPESLPCRTEERKIIEAHIRKGLKNGGNTKPIYISGMPGTGKTATVLATVAALKKEVSAFNLPDFDFIEINCLRLATAVDAYTALWRGIDGTHVSSTKALDKLNIYFESGRSQSILRKVTVCLVDEIDFLITRDDNIVYNFFNWPTFSKSALVVIGISNIMDLPERLSTRVASRCTLERVMFGPYSYNEVQVILENRLKELNLTIFNDTMYQLLARKASAVAGDLRAALKICQRSIEIFREQSTIRNINQIDNNIINAATNEYKGSPMMATVSLAPALDKAIILTMCKNYNVNGETETVLSVLWDRLLDLFQQSFKDPNIKLIQPPYFIFEEALERIIHQGLVKRAYSRGHSGSKIAKLSLRIEITDVRSALKEDPLFKYGGF